MNYWERHIGDYARDAGHLSMLEHGAYTLLLDRYYTTEQPIASTAEAYRYCRARSRDERAAVDAVLAEFFVPDGEAWRNRRCEEEIAKARTRIEAARTNGAMGGRPKRKANETQREPDGLLPGSIPLTQQKALHTPDTSIASKMHTADTPLRVVPPPPAFDGNNGEALNGKAVVPIAAEFALPEAWGYDAEALGFKPAEVLRESERFRQYWTAGKGSGTRRSVKGWRQSWSNWLAKTAERQMR